MTHQVRVLAYSQRIERHLVGNAVRAAQIRAHNDSGSRPRITEENKTTAFLEDIKRDHRSFRVV